MSATPVSPERFVRAWFSSSSVAQVRRKTGLKAGAVHARVSLMRRNGVKLPAYRPASAHPIDWARLRALAERLSAVHGRRRP